MGVIQAFFSFVLMNKMIKFPVDNFATPSSAACLSRCLSLPWCQSVSFSKSTSECNLANIRYETTDVTNLVQENGWIYSQMFSDLCPASLGYKLARPPVSLCYKIFNSPLKNVTEGKIICKNEGGDLIKLDTEAKNTYMKEVLDSDPSSGNLYYFGLREVQPGDVLTWPDDSLATYTNWAPDEPSLSSEQFGGLEKNKDYKWVDLRGSYETKFICEIPLYYRWT